MKTILLKTLLIIVKIRLLQNIINWLSSKFKFNIWALKDVDNKMALWSYHLEGTTWRRII